MSRRILVTGASGFIGRHTLGHLQRLGFELHAAARHAPPAASRPASDAGHARTAMARPPITWHRSDLLETGAPEALISPVRPETLLHLAWEATPGRFWTSPDNERWRGASRDLLGAFLGHGGRRVVMTGSGAEYDWRQGRCDEASTSLRPTTAYSRSKDALRRELEATCRASGVGTPVSWAWARLFCQFGPGEAAGRLVPDVIDALLEGRDAECSSGLQRRDFLYVDDVGRALAELVGSEVQGCVNIGSGAAISIADLARSIGEAMGRPAAIRLRARPSHSEEPPLVEAETRRLREEVGFEPAWSLECGIRATIDARRAARAGGGAGER